MVLHGEWQSLVGAANRKDLGQSYRSYEMEVSCIVIPEKETEVDDVVVALRLTILSHTVARSHNLSPLSGRQARSYRICLLDTLNVLHFL